MFEAELANRSTVSEMVDAYSRAGALVVEAYEMLADAKKTLETAFGSHYNDFGTIPGRDMYYREYSELPAEIMRKIKKSAWCCIVEKLGIKKVMSVKASEELSKKLQDEKSMPEIDYGVIFATLEMMVNSADDYAKEAIKEVYEILRPAATRNTQLKTNQKNAKFALGKKVILPWKVEGSYSSKTPFRVSWRNEAEITAIDKVFHQLDGAGIPDGYKSELVDAISTSPDGYGETEYFKFRACENRNLHLEFKRLDLVNKLNQVAGAEPYLRS